MRPALSGLKRLAIKIGSSTLIDPQSGSIRAEWFAAFAADIARLRARGQEVLIISSGAIALGRGRLRFSPGPLPLEQSQAAAAVGQIELARAWSQALAGHGHVVAQVLLTYDDTEERRRYLNARATLNTLLAQGAIPVINENDTVATAEIRYGDNDRLAARVAAMMACDGLVLLSDIDGLYTADPRKSPDATLIETVPVLTPDILSMGGGVGSAFGSGGMATKLMAAKLCMEAGCHMAIARGTPSSPLSILEGGGPQTWFLASATPQAARKRWIAGALKPQGQLTIDEGAVRALGQGKSLLPAGVVAVDGTFERGDCVAVCDLAGHEIARGLIAYDAGDAHSILGRRSAEIEILLGFKGRDEIIHRDDLVLMGVRA